MPAPVASSAAWPTGSGAPDTTAATPTSTRPVTCETSRTHRTARLRVLTPARKSEAPQARLAPRARTTGTMVGTLDGAGLRRIDEALASSGHERSRAQDRFPSL